MPGRALSLVRDGTSFLIVQPIKYLLHHYLADKLSPRKSSKQALYHRSFALLGFRAYIIQSSASSASAWKLTWSSMKLEMKKYEWSYPSVGGNRRAAHGQQHASTSQQQSGHCTTLRTSHTLSSQRRRRPEGRSLTLHPQGQRLPLLLACLLECLRLQLLCWDHHPQQRHHSIYITQPSTEHRSNRRPSGQRSATSSLITGPLGHLLPHLPGTCPPCPGRPGS